MTRHLSLCINVAKQHIHIYGFFITDICLVDKLRHALATWKTMSDTSSPEGTPIKRTQIKKTQKSRRKLTTTDEYNRESSKELRDKLLGKLCTF